MSLEFPISNIRVEEGEEKGAERNGAERRWKFVVCGEDDDDDDDIMWLLNILKTTLLFFFV
jgi:hypothetical protein